MLPQRYRSSQEPLWDNGLDDDDYHTNKASKNWLRWRRRWRRIMRTVIVQRKFPFIVFFLFTAVAYLGLLYVANHAPELVELNIPLDKPQKETTKQSLPPKRNKIQIDLDGSAQKPRDTGNKAKNNEDSAKPQVDLATEQHIAQPEATDNISPIPIMQQRREAVKNAFLHAWTGYERAAWGHDEVRPVSNISNDSWGGFAVTLLDALDTMLIMGLDKPFIRAREYVETTLDFDKDYEVSFFETTIRHLGGLLGAYELSRDPLFLQKAKQLADRLLYAFNTTTGIPMIRVNLQTHKISNPSWNGGTSVLAELGSVQLEFLYLSYHLGDTQYSEKIRRMLSFLSSMEPALEGLYPVYIDPRRGVFTTDLVSFGGLGDSFYEYLLKQWLLEGKRDSLPLDMYLKAIRGMKRYLVGRSVPDQWTFVGEWTRGAMVPKMDHLVCYVPGMLALGAAMGARAATRQAVADSGASNEAEGSTEADQAAADLQLAKELVDSCVKLYFDQPTGLGPDRVAFRTSLQGRSTKDYLPESKRYMLRPETVESLFVLWRVTHDEKYREWGWQIFEALEKKCKTPVAYSGLLDVTSAQAVHDDSMQSFFLAETLKYLYLLFSDDDLIPIDKYVFTTEAHPLGVFK